MSILLKSNSIATNPVTGVNSFHCNKILKLVLNIAFDLVSAQYTVYLLTYKCLK